jgi:hypothetical protein
VENFDFHLMKQLFVILGKTDYFSLVKKKRSGLIAPHPAIFCPLRANKINFALNLSQ